MKCLGLLGIILIFMLTIDGIISLILYRIFQDPGAYAIYYSKIDAPTYEFTPILVLLYCSMNLFKYLAAFGIFIRFTGIPLKVAAPVPKGARLSKKRHFPYPCDIGVQQSIQLYNQPGFRSYKP